MTRRQVWAAASAAGVALFAVGCGSSAPPEAPTDPDELKRLDEEIKANVRAEGAGMAKQQIPAPPEKK